ncbi:MAG: lipid A deacylase LpxR family protein [Chloroflexi bacterium]|nr:lipid A deacylase LpxR family protein [Chloroflexota bacterium]
MLQSAFSYGVWMPALVRLCSAFLGAGSLVVALAEDKQPPVLAAILENDLLYNPAPGKHQDRHYTQGLKLIYLDRGEPQLGWTGSLGFTKLPSLLPGAGMQSGATNFGLVLGQNIFTPEDNRATNLITADRPYAGWLYIGAAIQRRGLTSAQRPVLESYELNLGVIGPEAQGEWAQNSVHHFRGLPAFAGWGNQLKTEPALVFKYGRAWKWTFNEPSSRYFDAVPQGGLNLGTVATSAGAGLTLRLGWNMPDDFGVPTIDSSLLLSNGRKRASLGFYIFGRAEGRAVARNAFLDGNWYQRSHRVNKKPVVADLGYGAAVTFGQWCELSWTFLTRTPEFDGQKGFDQFGSVTGKLQWSF